MLVSFSLYLSCLSICVTLWYPLLIIPAFPTISWGGLARRVTTHSLDVSTSHAELPVTVAFPCEALAAVLEFQIVDGPMDFDVVFGPEWTTLCKEKLLFFLQHGIGH